MNKTAIKNFAVEARVMLINAVTQLAYEFEVTENGTNDPAQESVNGRSLTAAEKNQRSQLIANIRQNADDGGSRLYLVQSFHRTAIHGGQ